MLADQLPDFPWDLLQPAAKLAANHPAGLIDLSVGTPVDAVAPEIQAAAAAALDAHAYPLTAGTAALIAAQQTWLAKIANADATALGTIPTIGSKEAVALLPLLLGLTSNSKVAIPKLAYPTYAVGAQAVGATVVLADTPAELTESVDFVWLNSPSNPTGRVHSDVEIEAVINWSRKYGVLVASDECYLPFPDGKSGKSLLSLNQGDNTGFIALHSLSKRSNLAGYRAAFAIGDRLIIKRLLEIRKHVGLMVPLPVQRAMTVALQDEGHVRTQAERYRSRRRVLSQVLREAKFDIEHSESGLYIWCTRGERGWDSVAWFADLGIIVTPGSFYGESGTNHVRIALTATDAQIEEAASRISAEK